MKHIYTFFTAMLLLLGGNAWGQTTTVSITATGTSTWTVPAGVTSITVQAWGAGGGGDGGDDSQEGGGGGAFASVTFAVTPGQVFTYTVPAGGVQNATNGSVVNTSFSSTTPTTRTLIVASGLSNNDCGGGCGGTTGNTSQSGGTSYFEAAGGDGGNDATTFGGGGGGAGGPGGAGADGTATASGGGLGQTPGGNGGHPGGLNQNGNLGTAPGGGGGGHGDENTNGSTTSANGQRGEIRITYTIPVLPPTVNITLPATSQTVANNTLVNFTAAASVNGTATSITGYAWDFDEDGQFDDGTGATPSFTFLNPGPVNTIITVSVRATDNLGSTAVATRDITVQPNLAPTAAFTWLPAGTTHLTGTLVTFDGTTSTDTDGSIAQWEFDYDGDGNYDLVSNIPTGATHTYNVAGVFTPKVRVTDNQGAQSSAQTTFTITASPPAVVTITNPAGPITINNNTLQAFAATATAQAPATSITQYAWDLDNDGQFDDGFGATTTHTFQNPGVSPLVIPVTIRVADNLGTFSTASVNITVQPNALPTATITTPANLAQFAVGTTVNFNGTGNDPDGQIASYKWDLTNGTTGFINLVPPTQSPNNLPTSLLFSTTGDKTITLTVKDNTGAEASTVRIVYINGNPTAVITAPPAATVNVPVAFSGSASFGSNSLRSIVSYEWDWTNDGSYDATGSAPSFTYTTTGTFTVKLRVTDDLGAQGEVLRTIVVSNPVAIDYTTSTYWRVPPGITSVTVEAWGGGGEGFDATTGTGGGAGGGAYAKGTITVVPGTIYRVLVGRGGTGTLGASGYPGQVVASDGRPSWFQLASAAYDPANALVKAAGGIGATSATNSGAGGTATSGTTATTSYIAPGVTGGVITAGSSGVAGGNGGASPNGGAGGVTGGTTGQLVGGHPGGGGARGTAAGSGSPGMIRLTYNVPAKEAIVKGIAPAEDWDQDGIANSVDLDDDNDGILDVNEGSATQFFFDFGSGARSESPAVPEANYDNEYGQGGSITARVQQTGYAYECSEAWVTPNTKCGVISTTPSGESVTNAAAWPNFFVANNSDPTISTQTPVANMNDGEYMIWSSSYFAASWARDNLGLWHHTADFTNAQYLEEVTVGGNTVSSYGLTRAPLTPTEADNYTRMAMFNAVEASTNPNLEFFRRPLPNIQPGKDLVVEFMIINLDTEDALITAPTRLLPNVQVRLFSGNFPIGTALPVTPIFTFPTGNIPAGNRWYKMTFTVPAASITSAGDYTFSLVNLANGGLGNDLAFDNLAAFQSGGDTDNDGIDDQFDSDSDNDGISDVVEAGGSDPDNDGFAGIGEPVVNALGEVLVNGIAVELIPTDPDGDGITSPYDLDSDDDGMADVFEAGGSDPDNDGIYGTGTPTIDPDNGQVVVSGNNIVLDLSTKDSDGDGKADAFDIDADNDGIVDVIESQSTVGYKAPTGIDHDGDGIDNAFDKDFNAANQLTNAPYNFDGADQPDHLDADSDNDGSTDMVEANQGNYAAADADGDGLADVFDDYNLLSPPGSPAGTNSDNNGQESINPFPGSGSNPGGESDWRFTDAFNVSGIVYYDTDGLTDVTFDGTATPTVPTSPAPTQLYVNYIKDGIVQATVPVGAGGLWSMTDLLPSPSGVFQLSQVQGVVGQPKPATTLPTGWGFTGEGLTGAGDGTPNGEYPVLLSQDETTLNFGFEQIPVTTPTNTATSKPNPGGAAFETVNIALFSGTDADGTVEKVRITAFPTNTTAFRINDGVTTNTYYNGTPPPACVDCYDFNLLGSVEFFATTATTGTPVAGISIDPVDNIAGSIIAVFTYLVIDNAGLPDDGTGVVNVPFSGERTITVTGTPVCVDDVPFMNYNITSNFAMDGLVGTITWTTGTPQAPNPFTVAIVNTETQNTPTLSGTSFSGTAVWPGATFTPGSPNVATDWPGWIDKGGAIGWVYEEDGYSGYRSNDVGFSITVNPTDAIDGVINYPPSSPFCTAQPRVSSFTGTVWQDVDGSGTPAWANIPTGGETGTNAGTTLYAYALGISPATGLQTVLDKAVVAANGTYSFTDLIQCDNVTIVLSTNGSFAQGDDDVNQNNGGGLPTELLPTGWAATSPATRGGITTLLGNVSAADLGIQQLPISGIAGNNGTVNNNTLITPIYNPGVIGREQIPAAAFGGTDPDGSVTEVRITALGTNVHSITIGGATGTTYYKNAGDIPGTCPTASCVVFPVTGVEVPANALGQPTTSIEITPVATFIDGNLTLDYKVLDNANVASGNGAPSDNTTTLTIPIVALKYDLTNGNSGWYNGGGTIGGPGAAFKPNTTDDVNHTLFWISTPATNNDILDVDAVVANVVVFPGVEAVISGCLTVNDGVKVDGTVRFFAVEDGYNGAPSYGQYLGPKLPNTIFEMILSEEGWHKIGIPVSNANGSPLTAQDFADQNNTLTEPDKVSLTPGDPSNHNLWWYDTEWAGGKEHGFFINRTNNTILGGLGGSGYSSHAYGTWRMVQAADELELRGLFYYVDGNFANSFPTKIVMEGTTNDEPVTYTTHDNWGGWNMIPNPYPVSLDVTELASQVTPANNIFGTGFDQAIWIWNPGDANISPLPGNLNLGAYVAVDALTGNAVTYLPNATGNVFQANLYVAPMQSFYIRRTSASKTRRKTFGGGDPIVESYAPNDAVGPNQTAPGTDGSYNSYDAQRDPLQTVNWGTKTVTIRPEHRANCAITTHYKTKWDLIMLYAIDETDVKLGDATEIVFDDNFTYGYDESQDIQKIGVRKGAPVLFTLVEGLDMVINKMNYPEEVTTVPVGFYAEDNNKTYRIEMGEMPEGWQVYLEDKLTGNWHDLRQGAYPFKNRTDFRIERFVLHFSMKTTPIDPATPEVIAWGTKEGIELAFDDMRSLQAEVTVTNLIGQVMHVNKAVDTSENYIIPINDNDPQVYLVTIVTEELTTSIKVVR